MKTVLLSLRPSYGARSGVVIAEELLIVMRELKVSDRVGYFVANNASFVRLPTRRCIAHILNLVAEAILYGTDTDCVADAARFAPKFDSSGPDDALMNTSEIVRPRNESANLTAWRKRGR